MDRAAVVAGSFYEARASRLRQQLAEYNPQPLPARAKALGAMAPHAGYMYSGRTAAAVYTRLAPAEVYVLLGPNHTGRGKILSVSDAGHWQTPLGAVPVNREIAGQIIQACPAAQWDASAHSQEHSLEVQLPFLQQAGYAFSIVAIAVATYQLSHLRSLGQAIAKTLSAHSQTGMVLASSDMNHFADLARTRQLDQLALDRVLSLDPEGLLQTVSQRNISMCGAAPAAAMLYAVKELGAKKAECVNYSTSAEASGDESRVVGYAGVIFT